MVKYAADENLKHEEVAEQVNRIVNDLDQGDRMLLDLISKTVCAFMEIKTKEGYDVAAILPGTVAILGITMGHFVGHKDSATEEDRENMTKVVVEMFKQGYENGQKHRDEELRQQGLTPEQYAKQKEAELERGSATLN